MQVSEIMGSRASAAPHRCVVVEYPPAEQYRVMSAAVDLYRLLGVDIDVEGLRITVPCSEAFAAVVTGLVERRTGHAARNEWRSPLPAA